MTNELRESSSASFLLGGGEMGALMRQLDWSNTPLGNVNTWTQSLSSALSICLNSRFPIAIYWGEDSIVLYNDAWRPIVGNKHPWALGQPGHLVWSEIWNAIGPEIAGVVATGEGTFHKDEMLSMHRFGYLEECYFEYTFNPIRGQEGTVDGVFNIVTETTYRVLNDRRAQLLREAASKTGIAKTVEAACGLMLETLKSDPFDIPLALLYLVDADGKQARLYSDNSSGNSSGNRSDGNSSDGNSAISDRFSPAVIDLTTADSSSFIAIAAQTARPQEIADLVSRFGVIPGSPWAEPPQEAMALPILAPGQGKVNGVLVTVASPRRRLDEQYRDFLTQVAGQVGMAIANAQAYEEERKRAEALAEIDRAKTVFFSNVSHEFRTPLTLMLSPLEELSQSLRERLHPDEQEQFQLVQRNGLRLQKLVNTLLDFSRIEAGRMQATYEPTDLAAYTAELASVFRSALDRAGLRLAVDCPPLPEAVWVDREMWEKIVFNLLSNAFKFTFAGEIAVCLRWENDQVALQVRDTGIGIPASELPHLFERFHRVKGAQGRSFEGSGIGLSLVQELVKLHGGAIDVTSVEGSGTCFTISIPTGTAHLPSERLGRSEADRVLATHTLSSTALDSNSYLEEALRWLSDTGNGRQSIREAEESIAPLFVPPPFHPSTPLPRVLLADDNADMRDYVSRLLSQQYDVYAVSDGAAALSAVQQQLPDLVLTDVMMPNLDGFGLLQALRANPQTQKVPIILLSARAGSEARIEGLEAGADDYLTKPFSARELLARVEATLKLSRLRQEAMQQEQALRAASEAAQQQAEAALQRIDRLLESMGDAFVAIDRDWRIVYQNAASERINHKPRSEVLGKTLWEEWPAAIGSISEREYRRAIAAQVPVQFEQHYYEPNEHDVWLEVRAYPFEDGLGIFYRDISERKRVEAERKRAEAALQDSESRLRLILESAKEYAIFTLDLNGIINSWNAGAERLLGYAEAEAIGCSGRMVFTPEDNARGQAEREMHLALTEGRADNERWHVRRDGSRFWASGLMMPLQDEAGDIQGFVKIMQDKTAQRQANERFHLLYDTTSDLLATEQPMTLMHNLFSKLSGQLDLHYYHNFMVEEHNGRPMLHLRNYQGISTAEAEAIEWVEFGQYLCGMVAQQRQPIALDQAQIQTHPNAQMVCSMGMTAYVGQPLIVRGRLLGTLSFASRTRTHFTAEEVDLLQSTCEQMAIALERANLLVSIQQQAEELQQANRIKDEFLAVLSHELRSPLNPILGWSKLLQSGKLDPAKTQQALVTIERNAKLQSELIEDLLDVSRILQGKLSLNSGAVDLAAATQSAIETVRLAAEAKSIQVITNLDLRVGQVLGDATRLQQVVWNLLSNAVKFTPNGGRIEIRLERRGEGVGSREQGGDAAGRTVSQRLERQNPESVIAVNPEAASTSPTPPLIPPMPDAQRPTPNPPRLAQLTITDTGKGIPASFLPHVFDYFRQEDGATTRKFGGLGLGLAIVRHLVELHGGTVKAESPGEGLGATFIVRLPLLPIQPASDADRVLTESSLDLENVRVLVIDDEADSREFVAFVLEQAGASVTIASTASEGFLALKQSPPDILLSDIGMPDMDGYMLMRQIRIWEAAQNDSRSPEQKGSIKAIALTAYAGEINYQQAMQAGFQQHLAKPVDPEALVSAIAALLTRD